MSSQHQYAIINVTCQQTGRVVDSVRCENVKSAQVMWDKYCEQYKFGYDIDGHIYTDYRGAPLVREKKKPVNIGLIQRLCDTVVS